MDAACKKIVAGSLLFCCMALWGTFLYGALNAGPVFATDAGYVPLAPLPGTGAGCDPATDPTCKTDLGSYLGGLFKLILGAAGVLAFLMIVWGGFTYLSTDSLTGKEEGRTYIGRAVGGLILALGAYVILNTINPNLVNLNLNFGPPVAVKPPISAPGSLFFSSAADADVMGKMYSSDQIGGVPKTLSQQIDDARAKGDLQTADLLRGQATALNVLYRDTADIQKSISEAASGVGGLLTSVVDNRIAEADKSRLNMLSDVGQQITSLRKAGATPDQISAIQAQEEKNNQVLQKVIKAYQSCIQKYRQDSSTDVDKCRVQGQQ